MRFGRRAGRTESFRSAMRRMAGLGFEGAGETAFVLFALARTGLTARLTFVITFDVFLVFLMETFLLTTFFFFFTGRRGARAGALGLRGAAFFALAADFRAAPRPASNRSSH